MAKQSTEITTAREALLAFCQSLEMERRLLQFITGSAATGRAKSVRRQLGEVRKEPLRDTQAGIRRRLQAFVREGLGREFSQREEELLTAILKSREIASERGSYLQEKAQREIRQQQDRAFRDPHPRTSQDEIMDEEEKEAEAYWEGRIYEYEDEMS